MAQAQIIARPGVPQISITREFDAPRDLLFRAYTDPDLLVQWFGPRRTSMTVHRHDLRHGGMWRYVLWDADGNEYPSNGLFHGTPSPDGIVQTFEFEGMPGRIFLETVTFEDHGGKTMLSHSTVFQSVEDRDEALRPEVAEGVGESMERLDELLARLVPVS